MRGHWRIGVDIRRCLRFDPGLSGRIATHGLRVSDFEERILSLIRWEDAEGISAFTMRLHRISLSIRARREDYRGEIPWNLGPCWPELPAELEELPAALMHWLWWEPLPDPSAGEPSWNLLRFSGAGYSLAMRIRAAHPVISLSRSRSQRERRRCWLIRYRSPSAQPQTLLLVRTDS